MSEEQQIFRIEEAIEKVKNNSKEKFDATVEVHINLNIDKNQSIRFSPTLPHGTGKKHIVAVLATKKVPNADFNFSESDLDKIEKGDIKPGVNFDILIAEPSFMPKVAKVARVLGPAGVMPNPKAGTVTDKVAETVEQIKKGKIEVRSEKDASIIHTIIGKVSFSDKELKENFDELLKTLSQNRPPKSKPEWIKSLFIKSSMGKSYQVDIETE